MIASKYVSRNQSGKRFTDWADISQEQSKIDHQLKNEYSDERYFTNQ